MKDIKNLVLAGIFLSITVLTLYILKPYFIPLISSCILAFISYPLYNFVNKKINKKRIASLLTIIVICLVILIPLIFVMNSITKQAVSFYVGTSKLANTENIVDMENKIQEKLGVDFDFNFLLKKVSDFMINITTSVIQEIPKKVFELLLVLIVVYYLLINSEELMEMLKKYIPLHPYHKEKLLEVGKDIISGVFFGTFLTALIQSIIAGIGFYIFRVPNAILLGVLTFFAALLPVIGTGLIWGPAAIYLFAKGYMLDNGLYYGLGIGLILYGVLIVSTIDNFIRPYLISGKVKKHPLIIILGIIGGVNTFGFIGLFLGPIIITFFVILFEMHEHFFDADRPKIT